MSIAIKCRLQEKIIILSSLAHGFFNYTTSKMVTKLHDAELAKGQPKTLKRLVEPLEYSSKNSTWNIQKNSGIKNPDFMPQTSEINKPSSSVSFDKVKIK